MQTAIVLSDTHHNVQAVEKLLPLMQESNFVIHLGDGAGDLSRHALSLKGKLHRMVGNCDDSSLGLREEVLEVEGVRIFACHGHNYGVKQQLGLLARRAKECGCTVALYGHTHEGRIDELDGVLCINPGCATRYALNPSYCFLAVHNGKVTAKIVEIF